MAFLDSQGVSKLCALLKDKFDSLWTAVNRKQDALTAGANITINNGVISAADTDTTYTAGTGISIDSNNEISCTVSGGSSYTAGNGINIDSNNVISRDTIGWDEPLFSVLSSGLISNFTLGSNIGTYSSVADIAMALKQKKIAGTSPNFGFTSFSIKDLNDAMGTNYAGRKFSIDFTNSSPITSDYYNATSTSNINTGRRNSVGLIIVGDEIWCVNSGVTGFRQLFGYNLSKILCVDSYNKVNYTSNRLDLVTSQLDTAISTKLTAPTDPSTDGTYKLTSTITSGTPTYSWEADSGSSGGNVSLTYGEYGIPIGLFYNTTKGYQSPYFARTPAILQPSTAPSARELASGQFIKTTNINSESTYNVADIFPNATTNTCYKIQVKRDGIDWANAQTISTSAGATFNLTFYGKGTIKVGNVIFYWLSRDQWSSNSNSVYDEDALQMIREELFPELFTSSSSSSLPAAPSVDGNYILKCSVSSGTPTYSWESVTIGGSY